jgi:hypothetical protein
MIDWPDDLVLDIARRRCVLVLGAGISMHSIGAQGEHPKTWHDLLVAAADAGGCRRSINHLLKEHDYLSACDIIKSKLGKDEYVTFMTHEFLEPQYQSAPIHDSIFALDSLIVATPNVDKIYDTRAQHLGKGSVKMKYFWDNDLPDAIRRPNRIILKIHGTVDKAHEMIFTRREYAEARSKHAAFYCLLQALFITHTFIVLGCGINDPDIRLLLEDHAFQFAHSRCHYITLAKRSIRDDMIRVIESTMNLKVLLYSPNNNHEELGLSIDALKELVESRRSVLAQTQSW